MKMNSYDELAKWCEDYGLADDQIGMLFVIFDAAIEKHTTRKDDRKHLAGLAMQAIITRGEHCDDDQPNVEESQGEMVARFAVGWADALLQALEEEK